MDTILGVWDITAVFWGDKDPVFKVIAMWGKTNGELRWHLIVIDNQTVAIHERYEVWTKATRNLLGKLIRSVDNYVAAVYDTRLDIEYRRFNPIEEMDQDEIMHLIEDLGIQLTDREYKRVEAYSLMG